MHESRYPIKTHFQITSDMNTRFYWISRFMHVTKYGYAFLSSIYIHARDKKTFSSLADNFMKIWELPTQTNDLFVLILVYYRGKAICSWDEMKRLKNL